VIIIPPAEKFVLLSAKIGKRGRNIIAAKVHLEI
jgi:hypothetical protein